MRRRRGGAWIPAAGVLAAALTLAAPAPAAGSTFSISGRVVNGTTGLAAGGLSLTLHAYRQGKEVSTRPGTSAPDGSFRFDGLEASPGWSYRISTTYQEADYQTPELQPSPGGTSSVELTVYEATSSPENLRLNSWVVWVDRDPAGVAVQQDVEVENTGKTTFVGDEPVGEGKKAVLRLPLAEGARNFEYLGIFMECCAVQRAGTFVHTMPLTPGVNQGTVRYVTSSLNRLVFPVTLPTRTFTLLVPADVSVDAPSLKPAGRTQDRGVTYNTYAGQDLKPGTTLEVSLAGLASRQGKSRLAVLVTVWVAAAAAAGAVYFLAVRPRLGASRQGPAERSRKAVAASGQRQAAGGKTTRPTRAASTPKTQASGEKPGIEPDEGLLVEEIAALDLAFEKGLISRDTYARLRELRKKELVHARLRKLGVRQG